MAALDDALTHELIRYARADRAEAAQHVVHDAAIGEVIIPGARSGVGRVALFQFLRGEGAGLG